MKPLTEAQRDAKSADLEARRAADAAWKKPFRPAGELQFAKPTKPASEMSREELDAAWRNTSRVPVSADEKPRVITFVNDDGTEEKVRVVPA
jgi:hypothetical protein